MNVPLILYAADLCGDDDLLGIGSRHVATARRHLVRGDGSTVAGACLDTQTGECLRQSGDPGCRGDSCWARGQAWALYGFATCGRLLDFAPWLDTARQCAGYLIERLSGDPIPQWDLDAVPGTDQPRDSSAAAIAAAGLLELASAEQTVGTEQARQRRYLQDAAVRILTALCDPAYLAIDDPAWEGTLKQGVGDLQKGLAVGESLIWGDFFFLDALQRARRLLRAKRH
jgi:unsaturated chondroitin disaccharide hydrolase